MTTYSLASNRCLICATLLIMAGAALAAGPAATQPATTQPTVAELSQERVKLIKDAYQTQLKRYERGLCSHAEAFQFLRRLARVAMDSPPSDPNRIPILTDYVKQAADAVTETEQRYKGGAANWMNVFEARDALLEAQIWLAKAEAAGQNGDR